MIFVKAGEVAEPVGIKVFGSRYLQAFAAHPRSPGNFPHPFGSSFPLANRCIVGGG